MILLALLAFAAASPPFDITEAKTFSFGDVTAKSKTSAVHADRLIPVVRERIAARFRTLGLTETASNGDLRITASLTVESDRRPAYRKRRSHPYDYRGRLLILIRAGKDNALVWEKFPSFSEDEAKRFEERLHHHVDRAIAGFPSKSN